jgi:uncharacterized protein YbjT (DUF2867 family)
MAAASRWVFITGGTGYLGGRLIPRLLDHGHHVRALARPGSQSKLPKGCEVVVGNTLDHSTYADQVPPCDTLIQLAGVAHPSPSKGAAFRSIDLPAGLAGVSAAAKARVQHFIYVSVAHPAPIMQSYIEVRRQCEASITVHGLTATILRPWYVLGPGHRWPYLLIPFYRLLGALPATRAGAEHLGLVTLEQMVTALEAAVENPPTETRIWNVPEIRKSRARSPVAGSNEV